MTEQGILPRSNETEEGSFKSRASRRAISQSHHRSPGARSHRASLSGVAIDQSAPRSPPTTFQVRPRLAHRKAVSCAFVLRFTRSCCLKRRTPRCRSNERFAPQSGHSTTRVPLSAHAWRSMGISSQKVHLPALADGTLFPAETLVSIG